MREILFKGKRLDNGEWVEGAYCSIVCDDSFTPMIERPCIVDLEFGFWYEVDPDTVSQFTGLCDKNNVRIFEGDIVHILGDWESENWRGVNYNALIAFIDGGFCAIDGTIEEHGFRRYALARMDFTLEVIGNIHDNPELLEVEG